MVKKQKKKPARRPSRTDRELDIPPPPAPKRLTITLSESLSEAIDEEIRRIKETRPNSQATRASFARNILRKALVEPSESRWCQPEAREALRQEADLMEAEAEMLKGSGEDAASRSMYLQAAAREMEALSVLDGPDEMTILSSLFRLLPLIKRGTGYKHLPDVPVEPER